MEHKHDAFTTFEIILVLVVATIIGFVGYRIFRTNENIENSNETSTELMNEVFTEDPMTKANINWEFIGEDWQVYGDPPICPNPLFETPVDLSLVESILYPGQYRGADYKPHGGFRFAEGQQTVEVRAPMEARIVNGARYIEGQSREVQYMFEFHNDCGIAYRFDHLYTLSRKLETLANGLPEPKVDDSRTTNIDEYITVERGEILATSVGIQNDNNIFVDWGVYDLRQTNEASEDSEFTKQHENEKQLANYGVCWLNLLVPSDSQIVLTLPGSGESGETSDYC